MTAPASNKSQHSCQCGCQQSAPGNRMTFVRRQYALDGIVRPGLVGWMVRKECQEPFERELLHIEAASRLVQANVGRSIWRRVAVAAQLYDTKVVIFRRLKGDTEARKIARQAALLFIAPEWARKWLRWDKQKIDAHSGK